MKMLKLSPVVKWLGFGFAILAPLFFSSCDKEEDVTLSENEISDLKFLREEEKLAYDIYTYAFSKYGNNIFQNIASSENTHTNKVLSLLNDYNIEDPVGTNGMGVFTNAELQNIYNGLKAMVDSSETYALTVGATVEDLDIHDIEHLETRTTNSTILGVYSSLKCGSRNHLRSFVGALNGDYIPQYISQTEYDAIISGSSEQCGGN